MRIYNRSFRAEDAAGNPIAGAQVTLWDAKTGGSQLTDGITDLAGVTIAGGILVADTWGYIPDFQDTMNRADLWAIGSLTGTITGVERVHLEPDDTDDRVTALETTISGPSGIDARLTAVEDEVAAQNAATFNVAAYGAVGDAVTDDRPAIQTAIDAAAAVGGTVVLPPGQYLCGGSVVLKTGVTLRGSHGSGWPFRFPTSSCVLLASATFPDECLISMLGADITAASGNEGATRILDLDLSGELLPAGSVSGIHAQGEVMDVVLARMTIKNFSHNGIHTNIGTLPGATRPPHDWFMDAVVCYSNAGYGFSMNITDGWIRNCIASSNGLDGWLLGPFGSLTMQGCQALFNTQHGFNIAGGTQVGNVSMVGALTDRNGHDGVHLGSSTGSGSPPIVLSGITLNRDGRNGNSGGGSYAGLRIDGCANPVIINGITVNTGVDDDGSGTNSPQYGASLTGSSAYVQINGGYLHGNTAGLNDDGTTVVLRRFNVDEATGSKTSPTFVYGTGPNTEAGSLSVPGHALGVPKPSGQGLLAWSFDPANVASGKSAVNGTLYLAAVYVPKTAAATKIYWGINTAGATATSGQNFVGLYNAAGTLLASAGVDATVTTTGLATTTISSTPLTPGMYWVALLFNASTAPQPYRGGDLNATLLNAGVAGTPASMRFATNGTGRTSLPSTITPGSNAVAQFSYWVALG